MKRRFEQLMAEAMTVMPVWENGVGKLRVNANPRIAEAGLKTEEFPEATHEEYLECCRMLRESMERADAAVSRRVREIRRRRGEG